jgi:hypothetical protein
MLLWPVKVQDFVVRFSDAEVVVVRLDGTNVEIVDLAEQI